MSFAYISYTYFVAYYYLCLTFLMNSIHLVVFLFSRVELNILSSTENAHYRMPLAEPFNLMSIIITKPILSIPQYIPNKKENLRVLMALRHTYSSSGERWWCFSLDWKYRMLRNGWNREGIYISRWPNLSGVFRREWYQRNSQVSVSICVSLDKKTWEEWKRNKLGTVQVSNWHKFNFGIMLQGWYLVYN